MPQALATFAQPKRAGSRAILLFILLFWVAQYAMLTAQRLLMSPEDEANFLMPRLCVTLVGAGLSIGMAEIHRRMSGWSVRARLVTAVGIALLGCLIHAAANFAIFDMFMPESNRMQATLVDYVAATLQWFWCYAALSGILLALCYSFELAERELRIAQLRRVAHDAQLRALRYQLNPHFMFNTLNSIAALVSQRDIGTAERMVENLADFLRAGLSLDPQEDIPLEREIGLQSLYLDIETLRFGDRLKVEVDMDEEARQGFVPSLITQPLIENAVRHGVAKSVEPVTVKITARCSDAFLHFTIRNNVANGASHDKSKGKAGTGVGIANVAERLRVRFGHDCSFHAGPIGDGCFEAGFSIPFERTN